MNKSISNTHKSLHNHPGNSEFAYDLLLQSGVPEMSHDSVKCIFPCHVCCFSDLRECYQPKFLSDTFSHICDTCFLQKEKVVSFDRAYCQETSDRFSHQYLGTNELFTSDENKKSN